MDDRGLNSQIAIVLMLAIVVIAAGATAMFGFDIASVVGGEPPPQANFEVEYDANDGVVEITHGGGDSVTANDTSQLEVVVTDDGSGQATYEWANTSAFPVQSTDAFVLNSTASKRRGNVTHRPGFEAGDTVQVRWVAPDASRTSILATYRIGQSAAPATRLTNGLRYEYYEASGDYTSMPNFGSETPVRIGTTERPDISLRDRGTDYAFQFTGYVEVPADGSYTFYTTSDDGSEVFIDGSRVVDNRGLHGDRERSGTVTLSAGYHEITVTHFEHHGSETLELDWSGPGISKQSVPNSALYREPVLAAAMTVDCFDTDCTFNGTPSTNGGAGIDGYEWSFGDSTTATGENVTHDYASTGTYTVALTVETSRGRTRTVTRTVSVDAANDPRNPTSTGPGVAYGYYEGTFTTMPAFPATGAVANGTAANFGADAYGLRRGDNFAYRFSGYVEVPANGTYTFWTGSDDGSYLYIDGERVVSNGGLHPYEEASGTIDLEAGNHSIVVTMYEHTGQESLDVFWAGPSFTREPIPDANLTHNDSTASMTPGAVVSLSSRGRPTGAPTAPGWARSGPLEGAVCRHVTGIARDPSQPASRPVDRSGGVTFRESNR